MDIEWGDLARAARETAEDLKGHEWVRASTTARFLLADVAVALESLRGRLATAEREREALIGSLILHQPGYQLGDRRIPEQWAVAVIEKGESGSLRFHTEEKNSPEEAVARVRQAAGLDAGRVAEGRA